jgi:peroxiredoxin Q/BCP
MLKEGDTAPAFTLKDAAGEEISLARFKGKKVVVYFYPKDDTPGCTKEACGIRDVYPRILAQNAVVIGISADTEESHKKFKEKYNLPFYLLSDPERKVIKDYNAWGEKSIFGKLTFGIIRSTFVIDEAGKIRKIFPHVNPAGHEQEILQAL